MRKPTSQNVPESEINPLPKASEPPARPSNLTDFAAQKFTAKSHIQALVKHIAREVRRHKLGYNELRYVFRVVRRQCEIQVPREGGRKLKELPSGTELEQFFSVINNPGHKLIFETLLGTGLRISELCGLQVSRIDFAGNLIFVSEGKGGKDRVVVMGNGLREKLELYLQGRRNKYLFESSRHTRFSSRRIEQLCCKYKTLAGIERDLTPHTLRHIWNTKLAELGIPEEKRAVLAGHADNSTQRIYTHLSGAGMKAEIIAALDKVSRR